MLFRSVHERRDGFFVRLFHDRGDRVRHLARVRETLRRIALEEILKRFPEWDVDLGECKLSPTSTVRGWETMPAVLG